jgi:ketosteroid isomerase-like protein
MLSKIGFFLGIGFLWVIWVGCQSQTLQSHLLEPAPALINFALMSKGATAEASQGAPNHLPEEVIDGDTSSETWDEGSGWGCSLEHLRTSDLNKRSYVQVNLAEPVDIRQIVMYTIDSKQYPATQYGLKDYRIEYWHGTGWAKIPTGDTVDKQYTARNNTKGKRVHDIHGRVIAQHIRLVPVSSNDTVRNYQYMGGRRPVYEVEGMARVMELEVWGYPVAAVQTAKQLAQTIAPQAEMSQSHEEMIQAVLKQYEAGYDTANLEQVMSCFSKNYNANGRTYDDIHAKASSFFERYAQINMTLANIDVHQNVIDGTAVITGIYTLQYTPKDNGKAQQTSGNLSLVLANEDETWRIISAN